MNKAEVNPSRLSGNPRLIGGRPRTGGQDHKMTTICNSNSAFCVYDQGGQAPSH